MSKEEEEVNFKKDMDNKILLFHGSKVSILLGIMALGLRAQPLEV
jgi:hypothetical protein